MNRRGFMSLLGFSAVTAGAVTSGPMTVENKTPQIDPPITHEKAGRPLSTKEFDKNFADLNARLSALENR
jgi:hypothetical protein